MKPIVVAVFVCMTSIAPGADLSGPEIFDRAIRSTVYVKTAESSGTAVIIGRRTRGNRLVLLTNFHVVQSKGELGFQSLVKVHFPRWRKEGVELELVNDRDAAEYDAGQAFTAQVTVIDPKVDLALLEIEESREEYRLRNYRLDDFFVPIEIAKRNPNQAEPVHAVGNAARSGGLWNYRHGAVSNVYSNPQSFVREDGQLYRARTVEHSVPINPGDSGSALLDSQGRLIGINVSFAPSRILREGNWESLEESRLISHAIHRETVREFLKNSGPLFAAWEDTGGSIPRDKSDFTSRERETRAKYFMERGRGNDARDEYLLAAMRAEAEGDSDRAFALSGQATRILAEMKVTRYAKRVRVENNLPEGITVYYSGGLRVEGAAYMEWNPKETGKFFSVKVSAFSAMVLPDFLATELILFAESDSKKIAIGSRDKAINLVGDEGYLSQEAATYQVEVFRVMGK